MIINENFPIETTNQHFLKYNLYICDIRHSTEHLQQDYGESQKVQMDEYTMAYEVFESLPDLY